MNHKVIGEYVNARGRRTRREFGYGNFGCTRAVEWFDKHVGKTVQLEPTLKSIYRVYTYKTLNEVLSG
jgi:hypothetical protein